jgi:2-polyprenyl-3-methyl-5-hydroxy-6-metoxy-1,4-benzoquinol methylase
MTTFIQQAYHGPTVYNEWQKVILMSTPDPMHLCTTILPTPVTSACGLYLRPMPVSSYVGSELELFSTAHQWKAYWSGRIKPHVTGAVLDVGAGLGASLVVLANEQVSSWHLLEPDPELTAGFQPDNHFRVEVQNGTLGDVNQRFDSILYIDVLEHIEADKEELALAADHLNPGGKLIVLAPAHNYLFGSFDAAIGHFRRYDTSSLAKISPSGLRQIQLEYLDSVGMIASTANKFLLKQEQPTPAQIHFWDNYIVPVSRLIDPILLRKLGKSVIVIWQK